MINSKRMLLRLITFVLSYSLLLPATAVQAAEELSDLDADGVADHQDVDVDNDGLLNTEEGYRAVQKAQLTPAAYYLYQHGSIATMNDEQEARYLLLSSAGDAWLHGTVRGDRELINWMDQEGGVKLQSGEPAVQYVEWKLQDNEQPITINADITITDLDPERSETIVVSTESIVGYSIPTDSSISVERAPGYRLTFTATPSASLQSSGIVLHVRGIDSLVIGYQYQRNADVSIGGRAGFLHSFSKIGLSNYTMVVHEQDTDADGIPDYRDSDSDNDGIADVVANGFLNDESHLQGIAVERDGRPVFAATLPEPDSVEASPVDLPAVLVDNTPDFDADGLSDEQEGVLGTDHRLADTDADGFTDTEEVVIYHTDPLDSHSNPNSIAEVVVDSDEDGIADSIESSRDSDEDGIPDQYDLDSDNDGISDVLEAGLPDADFNGLLDINNDVLTNAAELPDTDGDLVPNLLDLDSDADGYFDRVEAQGLDLDGNGTVDAIIDANGNGWGDHAENSAGDLPDQDNDGLADFLDSDSYPVTALIQDDAVTEPHYNAVLNTGVKGVGCVLASHGRDYSLLWLLLMITVLHYYRRIIRR